MGNQLYVYYNQVKTMLKKLLLDPRHSFDVDKIDELKENDRLIRININGVELTRSELFLTLLTHYEVNLPMDIINRIKFHPTTSKVVRNRAGFIMSITPPHAISDGYFVIPGFTRYGITKTGTVKFLKVDHPLGEHLNPYGYPVVNLYDSDKMSYRPVAVHILLALTFIPNLDFINKSVVNHKDGDKANYALDNLEWSTPTDNNIHAFQTNLRKDNTRCKVRDIITGEITEHYSKSDAFRKYKLNRVSKTTMLFNGIQIPKLFNNRYEFKNEGDDSDWYHQSAWIGNEISTTVFQVKNMKTGEVREFNTPVSCGRWCGIGHKSVVNRAMGNPNIGVNGFLIRVKTEEPWPTNYIERPNVKRRCIRATEVETGLVTEYRSMNQAVIRLGVDKQTLKLKMGTGLIYRGYIFEEVK